MRQKIYFRPKTPKKEKKIEIEKNKLLPESYQDCETPHGTSFA